MPPCLHNHCPSYKRYCQRSSCTLELRNRLERRRSTRNQLQANLKAETTSAMETLRKLTKECCRFHKTSLLRAKQKYEDQTAKSVGRLRCFCAECAIEHKDREISALRSHDDALRTLQRAVMDVQRECVSKSKPKPAAASPRFPHPGAAPAQKNQRHRAVAPANNFFDVMAMLKGLSVKELRDMGATYEKERVVFPRRHHH